MGILKRLPVLAIVIDMLLGASALGMSSASADSTALPVWFVTSNGATMHYNSDGGIVATTPAGGNPETAANVLLTDIANTPEPQTPPSFTVDNYQYGNPYWYIVLNNDVVLRGYPAQIGGTANDSFTGAQWLVGRSSTTYVTWQQALAQADPGGTALVGEAEIMVYGGAAATTDTLTNVQFDGETPVPGTVTVAPVPAQTLTAGEAAPSVQVQGSTTETPSTVFYSDNGTLPAGLSIEEHTGVISGTPTTAGTSTATITVEDRTNDTSTVQISYTVNPGPTATTACSASTGCSWQRLANPSSMVMDVSGQIPSTGAAIIAYSPKAGDPAADFTAVASGFGSSKQLKYTPYGTLQNANVLNATLATDAYNADGSAKYCVSSVADTSGQALQLRPCATTANQWQDFVSGGDTSGGSMIEPTYGTPGVSAGSSPMAINDKGYGGNGTPLINYAATGTGNELFTPGV